MVARGKQDRSMPPTAPASGGHTAKPTGRAFWLWAVMDNLTTGGAVNALALASELLGGGVS
jgi:hypothetical protein